MSENEFIENLKRNLEKNGYPSQRVAFNLERLYASAHEKKLNFNKILDQCATIGIGHEKTSTKIIFFPIQNTPDLSQIFGSEIPPSLADMAARMATGFPNDGDSESFSSMMGQVQKMLESLPPEQRQKIAQMVQNLPASEREELYKKARQWGEAAAKKTT